MGGRKWPEMVHVNIRTLALRETAVRSGTLVCCALFVLMYFNKTYRNFTSEVK